MKIALGVSGYVSLQPHTSFLYLNEKVRSQYETDRLVNGQDPCEETGMNFVIHRGSDLSICAQIKKKDVTGKLILRRAMTYATTVHLK